MLKERSIVNTSVFILAILVAVTFVYRYRPAAAPVTFTMTAPVETATVSEAPVVKDMNTIAPAKVLPNSNSISNSSSVSRSRPVAPPIVPPSIVSKVLPGYPLKAQLAGVEGTTTVRALVGTSGMVESVEIKTTSGSKLLDTAAAKAVSSWEFSPAMQSGAALASWYEVPVRFELED